MLLGYIYLIAATAESLFAHFTHTETAILLKNLKIQLDTDMKIILLDHQNN